jgi:hypothetical protein
MGCLRLCRLDNGYAPNASPSPPRALVLMRAVRNRAFAEAIARLRQTSGASITGLADALSIDRKDAHAICNGGRATAAEFAAAMAAFGESQTHLPLTQENQDNE